jgi:CheY-like chemotaxis protein
MTHILIVEDSLEIGRFIQSSLLVFNPGLAVKIIPSGEEAVLETNRQHYDLLICDLRLPGISGVELVRKLRVRHPELRVIFISGLSEETARKMIRDVPTDGFFRKPIDVDEFTKRVSEVLGNTEDKPAQNGESEQVMVNIAPVLPEVLMRLRQRLGAEAAFLLDGHGRVTAQAGETIRNVPFTEWINGIMAVLSGSEKVVQVLGMDSTLSVHIFQANEHDLVAAPVGASALLVVLNHEGSTLRLALAVEEMLAAQKELLKRLRLELPALLDGEPLPSEVEPIPELLEKPEETPVQPKEPGLDKLESVLKRLGKGEKPKDADAFWSEAVNGSAAAPATADAISYDQASQLGLAPPEEGE